jgi:AcrR family transcriptional regulator
MAGMSDTSVPTAALTRKPRGRPRRLSLDQLVNAGIELGLEHLSIGSLAAKLGVRVSTIYTYVDSVDELRRLVTAGLSKTELMKDLGQPWPDIVRRIAGSNFELLSKEPHLLIQIISGALEPRGAFAEVDAFLAQLNRRGFTEEEAFALYRAASWISTGAAMASAIALSWERNGETRRVKLARAFAEASTAEYPHLRKLGASFQDEKTYVDYRFAIEDLIKATADRRGEVFG